MRNFVLIYINGERHEIRGDQVLLMLSDYLRYTKRLVGTKVVCAEGDCGACSVLRCSPLTSNKKTTHFEPINSCITTVAQMDGSSLVTVEGLAKVEEQKTQLSPVQTCMVKTHGAQCGFCTPGFVVAMTGLVEKRLAENQTAQVNEREAKNYLTGNLCRCTGYTPIVKAMQSVSLKDCSPLSKRYYTSGIQKELARAVQTPVSVQTEQIHFFAPVTLQSATQQLRRSPETRLVAAGTDLGVGVNKNRFAYRQVMSLHLVDSLYQIKISPSRVRVGARVTLASLRRSLEKAAPEFAQFLDLFASPQIKNVATLVGNLANASPIADTPPFMLAVDADLCLVKQGKKRIVPLSEFYLDYKKTDLRPGEIISYVEFDRPHVRTTKSEQEKIALSKVSQRRDLDISCINTAFRARLSLSSSRSAVLKDLRLAMGGVAAVPLRLKKTEKLMRGQALTPQLREHALESLQKEISPLSDLRGSAAFRRALAEASFNDFWNKLVGVEE